MRERMLDITVVYFRCFDTPIQHAACGGGRTRPRAGGKGGKLIPCIALVGWVARQCVINDHSVSATIETCSSPLVNTAHRSNSEYSLMGRVH